jgi:hypothetical protein
VFAEDADFVKVNFGNVAAREVVPERVVGVAMFENPV